MAACHRCGRRIEAGGRVGRSDECPGCGADLHVCRNCAFFDGAACNECRETRAERVVEKDRRNFCDWFRLREGSGPARAEGADLARKKLDDLFRKG